MVDFFVRIAPVLVPHLAGRALTMKRYPEGVDQEYFFEKNAPMHRPDWVKTAPIWSESNHRTDPLHSRERFAHAGVDREPGFDRTASVTLAGRRYSNADYDCF